jgi:hypothetical protein
MDKDIQKEIERLNKLQEELEKSIDKEIKTEEEVIHAIEETVSSLILYQKANIEINGTKYLVKVNIIPTGKVTLDDQGKERQERQVVLIAVDTVKATIAQKQYIPCIVRSDYNYNLTQKGNLTIAVEGWVRHVTDTIKPEMLEGE